MNIFEIEVQAGPERRELLVEAPSADIRAALSRRLVKGFSIVACKYLGSGPILEWNLYYEPWEVVLGNVAIEQPLRL